MSGQGQTGTVTDRSRTQVGGARGLSLIGPGSNWAGQRGSVTDRPRTQVGGARGLMGPGPKWVGQRGGH